MRAATFAVCFIAGAARSGAAALPQEAYVWQRAWNDSVTEAVTNHGAAFSNLVVLRAEIVWRNAKPEVIPVRLDYMALAAAHRPVGIALRIGGYAGPFAADDSITQFLGRLATNFIAEARSNGISASEFQIDFDCASSKLDGYRAWVETLRKQIAPTPLTITVLPSWVKEPAFKKLAEATDGYVLQVHSLERPKNVDVPFTLCDPDAAKRAVEQAGKIGVPFRVALPTYGYLLAFEKSGKFVGISAEGPSKSWPAEVQTREVRADPVEMARLVQGLSTNGPSTLRGIIWYRLPTIVDNFNWRWKTLGAIVASRFPQESFRGEARRVEAGLVEINLVNDGELDLSSRLVVEVRWSRVGGARLVAADGLHGYSTLNAGPSSITFQKTSQPGRLAAGEQQTIGWLRFDRECEVKVESKRDQDGGAPREP
ncbi:MAG TPA: DUF3142 domain-containing protein [Verrucomicrobiae bacterium]|nr:DUF3142 domain-containing protein [Verrucomicrobiae bacterium]